MNPATNSTNPELPLWREAFAGLDWLTLRLSSVYYGSGVSDGRGWPVVVVPGMFASDASLLELEGWLRRVGYLPFRSNIGRNIERPGVTLPRLVETIDRAYDETGRRVIVIGHSLGGLLARGAALRRPMKVAHVVTLGSPVHGVSVHPAIMAAASMLCADASPDCLVELQHRLPAPVTETNIYTRDDGVVSPETCVRDDADAVEVRGTHAALIANPAVYRVLGEILARAVENEGAFQERAARKAQLAATAVYRVPAVSSLPMAA